MGDNEMNTWVAVGMNMSMIVCGKVVPFVLDLEGGRLEWSGVDVQRTPPSHV